MTAMAQSSAVGRIQDIVMKLGFDEPIALVYAMLAVSGPTTISEVARSTGIDRGKLYRLLPKLQETQLVEVLEEPKRQLLRAVEITELHDVVDRREEQNIELRSEIEALTSEIAPTKHYETTIEMFRGVEGIRHLQLRQLNASTEIICYTNHPYEEYVGLSFMRRWSDDFVRRDLRCRDLVNEEFLESVSENKELGRCGFQGMKQRFLPASFSKITHSLEIYDDLVTHIDWRDGDAYGVCFRNQAAADMHRSLFEVAWSASIDIPAG